MASVLLVATCGLSASSQLFVLCQREAEQLARLRPPPGSDASVVDGPFTIDLGFTSQPRLLVRADGVALPAAVAPSSPCVTWDELDAIVRDKRDGAWECEAGYEPVRIETFSEATKRHAKLLPVEHGCPTAVLAGFNMHRMKGTNPVADTREKLRAFGEHGPSGAVLDVCTGLGYTAIAAAKLASVERVTTIELDPGMVEMQRRNPWSRELFSSAKVERLLGDATALLPQLGSTAFSYVIHDPPVNSIAGDLYSLQFYQQLHRVLRPSGRLFHYIGDPDSKVSGQMFKGCAARLREAGFGSVKLAARAFGVVAIKR
ncbi:hypothetical protein KFE25_000485 [Diacronema lutheri]|uniref:Methyltransferase domain-containing protein n=1 Tax=Diacronema lutheri TaxID=2081491 RepID=A0A8J6CC42_DIALT|nr:hypothetical protein KFE25_000485 [Diacronema lutheri]